MLSYPAKILKDGDFFLVSFRDFYHEWIFLIISAGFSQISVSVL